MTRWPDDRNNRDPRTGRIGLCPTFDDIDVSSCLTFLRGIPALTAHDQPLSARAAIESLADNTLGRQWYEMRKGETILKDRCRHMVRAPVEIFLEESDERLADGLFADNRPWVRKVCKGDFSELPNDPTELELACISLAFNGYDVEDRLGGYGGDVLRWAGKWIETFEASGRLPESPLDLWMIMFATQREWRIFTGSGPVGDNYVERWRQIYLAWKSATEATEALSPEERFERPVFVPYREEQDPRELRIPESAADNSYFQFYCFDLLVEIYKESWERGVLDEADFSVRHKPYVIPETVTFNPQAETHSNYAPEEISSTGAHVVVAERGDFGDGVKDQTPYLVDAEQKFRVPFSFRVPVAEFSYADALREGLITSEAGIDFLVETGCFTFAGIPVLSREVAYERFRHRVPSLILAYNFREIDIDPVLYGKIT